MCPINLLPNNFGIFLDLCFSHYRSLKFSSAVDLRLPESVHYIAYRLELNCSTMKYLKLLIPLQIDWASKRVICNEQHGFATGRSTASNFLVYQYQL